MNYRVLLIVAITISLCYCTSPSGTDEQQQTADSSQASNAQQQVDSSFLLTKGKAGSIFVGQTYKELLTIFGAENVKTITEQGEEGATEKVFDIYCGSDKTKPAIKAIADESGQRIDRIILIDNRYKTNRGIGVGNTFGEFKRAYTDVQVGTNLYAEPQAFSMQLDGFSFGLDGEAFTYEAYPDQRVPINTIPDNVKIINIYVYL